MLHIPYWSPKLPVKYIKNTECTNVLPSSTSNYYNCLMLPFIPHKIFIAARMFVDINSRTKTQSPFVQKNKLQILCPVEDVSNSLWKILKLNAHRSSKITCSLMNRMTREKTNFNQSRDQWAEPQTDKLTNRTKTLRELKLNHGKDENGNVNNLKVLSLPSFKFAFSQQEKQQKKWMSLF